MAFICVTYKNFVMHSNESLSFLKEERKHADTNGEIKKGEKKQKILIVLSSPSMAFMKQFLAENLDCFLLLIFFTGSKFYFHRK